MRESFSRVVRAAAMLAGLGMLSLAAAAQQAKPPVKLSGDHRRSEGTHEATGAKK